MSEVYIYLIRFEAIRTRLLIPHFPFPLFASPPSGAVDKLLLPDGMQSVDFRECKGLTGTADSRMSDGHIYSLLFGGQPQCVRHSSIYPYPLFAFPFAGAVDKIVLPEGMQSVNFRGCTSLTGTAE